MEYRKQININFDPADTIKVIRNMHQMAMNDIVKLAMQGCESEQAKRRILYKDAQDKYEAAEQTVYAAIGRLSMAYPNCRTEVYGSGMDMMAKHVRPDETTALVVGINYNYENGNYTFNS